jgi:hypothetical protein
MVVMATESLLSKQFTTVPFRALLMGLTVILDISGRTFGPESLEKVIMELPIISGRGTPLTPIDDTGVVV